MSKLKEKQYLKKTIIIVPIEIIADAFHLNALNPNSHLQWKEEKKHK